MWMVTACPASGSVTERDVGIKHLLGI